MNLTLLVLSCLAWLAVGLAIGSVQMAEYRRLLERSRRTQIRYEELSHKYIHLYSNTRAELRRAEQRIDVLKAALRDDSE